VTEPTATASAAFSEYISEQLVEERARKTSLEARGLALITTSGAFTTLVLAIAALVGDDDLPGLSRGLLVLSLAGFLGAAVMGVVVNLPADYKEPRADGLRESLTQYGDTPRGTGDVTTQLVLAALPAWRLDLGGLIVRVGGGRYRVRCR
jgi:hypothetical protein